MSKRFPPQTEFKTFRFEVKSVDEDQGLITGYLSTFGNTDSQDDVVVKGAFKKTITEAKSRMQKGRRYLWPMLWMHDPERPIGGYLDAVEDEHGLLVTSQVDLSKNAAGIPNNPIATMVFSGYKSGYIDEQSIGYNVMQKDYKDGVRYLKEIRLVEGSGVTMNFAANPEALVPASGVKHMTIFLRKTVCGDTSLPIGPRDESWDGSEAHKQIVAWATDDDGMLDATKMKQVHLRVDGDADLITSYSYPFCTIVDEKPRISVGGVKACANALSGARNADPGEDADGMKKKVETLYARINKQYPDDTPLTPPWQEDDKRRMDSSERKDFNDLYRAYQAADCLEDWCDLINTLTQAMLQAIGMGDTPKADMTECLQQFSEAVMTWEQKAEESDLAQYLTDKGYCNQSSYVPYSLQAGPSSSSYYSYMTRGSRTAQKSGRTISAATQDTLMQHQKDVRALLAQHKNASDELAAQFQQSVTEHIKAMQRKVSDLTQLWAEEGQGPAYGNDPDDDEEETGKTARRREPPQRALPRPKTRPIATQPPHAGTEITLADLEAVLLGRA